jgi:TM2 domain-containing membrane protein YozV
MTNDMTDLSSSDRLSRQILVEQRVTNDGKRAGTAFFFWFFLGVLGGHRFYLGKPGTALLQIASVWLLLGLGLIWVIVDVFLIPGMVRKHNDDLRAKYSVAL